MAKRTAIVYVPQVYIQAVKVEYDDKETTLEDAVQMAKDGDGDDEGEAEYAYVCESVGQVDVTDDEGNTHSIEW